MRLRGKGVVVTGAGSGIGRPLAIALAAEGASVVVNDIDEPTAWAVADQIGGVAVTGDVGDKHFPAHLVAEASAELGFIDLYFSNAGIDSGLGFDDDDAWIDSLEVNVLSHVRTARALLPGWLEARRGHMVVTASAAGLLTMVGNAPYSVSKHSALAFAEWLAIEHGDQGITIQALCPQGVNTRMLQESGPLKEILSHDTALEPDDIARLTLDALESKKFLILPHPQVANYYISRATDTDRWLEGMRRLRRRAFGS
ncbi:SDR family NAD(P)-dependent oxidoreductase [Nocardia farcinica]|uniref:SDR family NAD(P)-dependent oxidoreductase n=1 Tax=Nocardia farcinica TaxID=37329 RepID=UPI002454B67E|nr:SDR family oxidoreductase [Nocardia farcinica]